MTRHTTATQHTADRKTPDCHYDHTTQQRVVRIKQPDGPDELAPCTQAHCVLCQREHTTHAQPLTCPDCIHKVRTDLDDIRYLARHLRWHASRGEGLAVPSARIPGGDAMTVMARAGVGLDDLVWSPHLDDDHGWARKDPNEPPPVVPVLLTLAGWEHQWRSHLSHPPRSRADRAPVTAITRYLADQLHLMAQATGGPDWLGFADEMLAMRRQLEGILHDERDPQTGVPCFECGRRLVRRWGDPKRCIHDTPGRRHLAAVRAEARAARERLAVLATYPELGEPTYADLRAARRTPTSAEESAARVPCTACATSRTGQGGIEDPSVGQSWECLGCRKTYTPGEYSNAVRAHLLTSGPDRDGWTHIAMAAEAATTMTRVPISANTVRKWMDRGQIISVCRWMPQVDGAREVPPAPGPARAGRPGHDALVAEFAGRVHGSPGVRLVYWRSVAEQAARAVERAEELERQRAERAAQSRRLYDAAKARGILEKRAEVLELGKSMGLHHSRVAAFLDEWDAAAEAASKESA